MTARSLATTLALLAMVAAPAAAQDGDIDPETGEVYLPPDGQTAPPSGREAPAPWYAGGPTGQTPPVEQPPARTQEERPPVATSDGSASPDPQPPGSTSSDGQDNHTMVVGRLAVGFVGIGNVPIGSNAGGGLGVDQISAPTLGVRYWLDDTFGIDVGLGIGYTGGSVGSGSSSALTDDGFAMTIHAGVPIAIFHDTHYTFELIPEMNLGFAAGTARGLMPADDRSRDGLIFELGARAGAEIQFGFIGIPNLSLLATVGLMFRYTGAGIGSNESGSVPSGSVNGFSFGTSLEGEPWDIFLGSLTAFYYFG